MRGAVVTFNLFNASYFIIADKQFISGCSIVCLIVCWFVSLFVCSLFHLYILTLNYLNCLTIRLHLIE